MRGKGTLDEAHLASARHVYGTHFRQTLSSIEADVIAAEGRTESLSRGYCDKGCEFFYQKTNTFSPVISSSEKKEKKEIKMNLHVIFLPGDAFEMRSEKP